MAEDNRTTAAEVAQLNDIAVTTGMSHAQVLEVAGVFNELKRLTAALEASEAARANLEATAEEDKAYIARLEAMIQRFTPNTARASFRVLREHDAKVLRDAADRLNADVQSLPRWPGSAHDMTKLEPYVKGVLDAIDLLRADADVLRKEQES